MSVSQIPLFSLLTNRMTWLSARQSVLASNVSNADTPNYLAHDLKSVDFKTLMSAEHHGPSFVTTNARHISVRSRANSPFVEELARGEGGDPSGNVVSLEQEMIKLSDTQVQYQTAPNLYQKAVNMFRTALGGRSS